MEQSCLICTEDFNNNGHSKRAPIACEYCSFTACTTCCQRYILDQEKSLCMASDCQKEWSRKFVVNNFPHSWVSKKWKDMNAKVGVDKEKALFPATMGVVAEMKAKEALKAEITELKNQERQMQFRRQNLEIQLRNGGDVIAEKIISNGRKCPDENCRGYLSTQWKCGLCEKWACHECHVIKGHTRDTEHTCDPDTLATAQLLSKDTKGCPKCSTPIHKIEGCDQMWCTQCHTGFSWRRGTIENRVHNPHYYEWQRQNGGGRAPRNVGDLECGRDIGDGITVSFLNRVLNKIPTGYLNNDIKRAIMKYIRNTIHLHEVNGRTFRTVNEDINAFARVMYITETYNEKKFTSVVHKNNKASVKKQEIFDVIQLQHQGVTDIVFRIVEHLQPLDSDIRSVLQKHQLETICSNIKSAFAEFNTLTNYSNSLLFEHSKTYQCKIWRINIDAERQYHTLK
mgnify:CR=1 FL=1|tara:strand:- start:4666 stop:6027 length:1362 start_codon:yes stop_codon:yes gene_type:complete